MTEPGKAKITRKSGITKMLDLWENPIELYHWEVETPETIFSCLSPDEAFEYIKAQGYEPSTEPFEMQQGRYECWWFTYVGIEEPEPDFIDWVEVAARCV